MNEEFYIGQKFYTPYPVEAAVWCNQNNAEIIEDYDEIDGRYYEIIAIPEPTTQEKKDHVRGVRDQYINDIEWRVSRYRDQREISVETTDSATTYGQILRYMQYLRDYPESSETWYEQEPQTFEEWKQNNN